MKKHNKNVIIAIFNNLARAFNTRDHTSLLQKIKYCGIRDLQYF